MSEVYGFCKAGCRYRVPTYDAFVHSASIIKQYATDGVFVLEQGKTYKVKKRIDGATEWGFIFRLIYKYKVGPELAPVEIDGSYYVNDNLPTPAQFDDYLKIKICEWYTEDTHNRIAVEINGERNSFIVNVGETYIAGYGLYDVYGVIEGDTECYLVNEDATVKAEDGDSAFIRYSANADGTDFTEKPVSGQSSYIGFATGKTAPTDKSGYQWFYLGAPEYDGAVVIE